MSREMVAKELLSIARNLVSANKPLAKTRDADGLPHRQFLASNLLSLLKTKPAVNEAWSLNESKDGFVSEMSDLGARQRDPWDQSLNHSQFHVQRDGEGEITQWTGTTKIDGQVVKLVIFND